MVVRQTDGESVCVYEYILLLYIERGIQYTNILHKFNIGGDHGATERPERVVAELSRCGRVGRVTRQSPAEWPERVVAELS